MRGGLLVGRVTIEHGEPNRRGRLDVLAVNRQAALAHDVADLVGEALGVLGQR